MFYSLAMLSKYHFILRILEYKFTTILYLQASPYYPFKPKVESADISPVSGASSQDAFSKAEATKSSTLSQNYTCKLSNKELEDLSELQSHLHQHHKSDEKKTDIEENIKKEIKEENVEEDDEEEEQIDVGDHNSEELIKTSEESSSSETSAQPSLASEQS